MNGRDRVLHAIAREPIDRVPLDLWARPGVWNKLMAHFSVDDQEGVQKCLGVDIMNLIPQLEDQDFAAQTNDRIPGDSTVSGFLAIDNGDGTYTDQWNVRYGLDPSLSVDHVAVPPFPEARIPEEYRWPNPDGMESEESLRVQIRTFHNRGFCVFGHVLNPFKQAWQLRGFDDFLMDMYTDANFAESLFEKLGEYAIHMSRRLIAAGVDVVCIVGDVAMQDRMFFHPDVFKALLEPTYRRIIEKSSENRKVPFFFHSDGNIMPIMESLADSGFSVVNPIQPESMDPVDAKKRFGDRLTLHGLISVQTTLPKGSVQDVRDAVRKYINECGQNGGLILSTTNDALEDIPLENLLAFYDEAKTYSKELYTYQEYEERR